MRSNNNLWIATKYPDLSTENWERAFRLLRYLEAERDGVMYKNIRQDMGLSYSQTIRAVGLLASVGSVKVRSIALWNGCNYIYPHFVTLT
jgi:hypothetical protein